MIASFATRFDGLPGALAPFTGLLADATMSPSTDRFQRMAAGFRLAFPDDSESVIRERVRAATRALFRGTIDGWHFSQMSAERKHRFVRKHVRYEGLEHLDAALADGSPILQITPHFGNLFITSAAYALAVGDRRPRAVLYDSPDKHPRAAPLVQVFDQFGFESIFADRSGTMRALKRLRTGTILSMLPDIYDVSPSAIYVPFLGHLALAMPGAAYFARAADALVLPLFGHTGRGTSYTVTFERPFRVPRTSDRDQDLFEGTARILASLEARIREHYTMWGYWEFLADRFARGLRLPQDQTWSAHLRTALDRYDPRLPAPVRAALQPLFDAGRDAPAFLATSHHPHRKDPSS